MPNYKVESGTYEHHELPNEMWGEAEEATKYNGVLESIIFDPIMTSEAKFRRFRFALDYMDLNDTRG